MTHTEIALKYFIANLFLRLGKMDEAVNLSKEIVERDVPTYFGHSQIELTVEPMLTILNNRFN